MGIDFNRRTYLYKAIDKDGTTVYVGISSQPNSRIKTHKTKDWYRFVVRFDLYQYPDRLRAMEAERTEVARTNPIGNILLGKRFKRVGRENGKYVPVSA